MWSVVFSARNGEAKEGRQALEDLCQAYWGSIYGFVLRQGHGPQEAEDLTQGFFSQLLARDWLKEVAPKHGRFRTFVLACLTNYLRNQRSRLHGPRRRPAGGFVPLEPGDDHVHAAGISSEETPEKLFEREWVATLVNSAKERLRGEYQAANRMDLFERLETHLAERAGRGSIGPVAEALQMSEGATRVALHRLRHRFGELLREKVAETVAEASEIDPEIRSLFGAWK